MNKITKAKIRNRNTAEVCANACLAQIPISLWLRVPSHECAKVEREIRQRIEALLNKHTIIYSRR